MNLPVIDTGKVREAAKVCETRIKEIKKDLRTKRSADPDAWSRAESNRSALQSELSDLRCKVTGLYCLRAAWRTQDSSAGRVYIHMRAHWGTGEIAAREQKKVAMRIAAKYKAGAKLLAIRAKYAEKKEVPVEGIAL